MNTIAVDLHSDVGRRVGQALRNEELACDAEQHNAPEHAKLHRLHDDAELVQRFLDWLLDERDVTLCRWIEGDAFDADGYYPISQRREHLMYDFFQVDAATVEKEKRAMLDQIRAANARAPEETDAG